MVHTGGYSQIGLLAEKPDHGCEHSDAQRLSRAEGRVIRARMKPNITRRGVRLASGITPGQEPVGNGR